MTYKLRVKNAVENYLIKQNKPKSARRNSKPEKQTQIECIAFMRSIGWSIDIYEAKATWNPEQQIWKNQGMKSGTVDCIGCTNNGHSVFVEFKAKGKLSTFNRDENYKQRNFLIDKINHGAFGCVVDCKDLLAEIYLKWIVYHKSGQQQDAINFLLSSLPQKTKP